VSIVAPGVLSLINSCFSDELLEYLTSDMVHDFILSPNAKLSSLAQMMVGNGRFVAVALLPLIRKARSYAVTCVPFSSFMSMSSPAKTFVFGT
jgi:hypothetical protein